MEIRYNMMYRYSNPVITANTNIGVIDLFVDTGATYPVWTKNIFCLKYLNCRQVTKENIVSIDGFGWKQGSTGYVIDISLNGLIYKDLPILIKYMGNMPGYMLVSASMLNTFNFKFNTNEGRMIIEANNPQNCIATLTDENGNYYNILECWRSWGLLLDSPIPIEETRLWRETYGNNSDLLPDIV